MVQKIVFFMVLVCFTLLKAETRELVFVAGTYAPYYYFDENNNITGSAFSIAKKVTDNINLKVTFKMVPWDECLEKVKDGSVDGILTVSKTKEREEFLYFPKFGITTEQFGLFTGPSYKGKRIVEMKGLKGLKVGLIKNYFYTQEFLDYTECQKIEANDLEELIKLLVAGKIDVMVGDVEVGLFSLQELDKDNQCKVEPFTLSVSPSYLAISKKIANSKEIYEKINKEISKMKFNGEMFKLQNSFNN